MWAILEIIAAIFKPLSKLWLVKIQNDQTPDEIAKRHKEEMARNLVKGDSAAESVRVNDLLRSLQNHSERQGRDDSKGGGQANRAS